MTRALVVQDANGDLIDTMRVQAQTVTTQAMSDQTDRLTYRFGRPAR